MKKILAVASSGGHWVQLSRLSPVFLNYKDTYVTTSNVKCVNVESNLFRVIDANDKQKIKATILFMQVLYIVFKVRPDVVISTGAAPGVFAIWISKFFFNAKTIWVDSLANSETISLSAKLVKKFADIRLTQWEHLVNDSEQIKYWGKVI